MEYLQRGDGSSPVSGRLNLRDPCPKPTVKMQPKEPRGPQLSCSLPIRPHVQAALESRDASAHEDTSFLLPLLKAPHFGRPVGARSSERRCEVRAVGRGAMCGSYGPFGQVSLFHRGSAHPLTSEARGCGLLGGLLLHGFHGGHLALLDHVVNLLPLLVFAHLPLLRLCRAALLVGSHAVLWGTATEGQEHVSK